MDPIRFIRERAKKDLKKIALPESEDERVLEAGSRIAKNKIARIVFLGNAEDTKKKLRRFGKYQVR